MLTISEHLAILRQIEKSTFVLNPYTQAAADAMEEMFRLLLMGLEIHDEYLSQIGKCSSQNYARLNNFPVKCAKLGIRLEKKV